MPDGSDSPENQGGPDFKKLDQSAKFIRRLRDRTLVDFPDARRLLEEGTFSEEEMRESSSEVGASNWDYTFTRITPEYLDLQIERKPRKRNAPLTSDKIRIIHGEHPLYERTKFFGVDRKELITSDADEGSASLAVRQFIEDMEAEFLPPQSTS